LFRHKDVRAYFLFGRTVTGTVNPDMFNKFLMAIFDDEGSGDMQFQHDGTP
jgi:hypothetical protein